MKLSRKRHSNKLPNALVLLLLLVYPVAAASTEDPRQDELDAMASKGRDQLLVQRPDLEEKLDQLPGYAVIAMTTTKIPGVGTGMGYGVIIDNRTTLRSYIKVSQFEVGGGLGAQMFKLVILFKDDVLLERIKSGGWRIESNADLSASNDSSDAPKTISSKSGKGYKVYKLAESGALGPALTGPSTGYGFVYQVEVLLLFITLVVIGPLARHAAREDEVANPGLGLAEFPGA